jgi:hypothetical protein
MSIEVSPGRFVALTVYGIVHPVDPKDMRPPYVKEVRTHLSTRTPTLAEGWLSRCVNGTSLPFSFNFADTWIRTLQIQKRPAERQSIAKFTEKSDVDNNRANYIRDQESDILRSQQIASYPFGQESAIPIGGFELGTILSMSAAFRILQILDTSTKGIKKGASLQVLTGIFHEIQFPELLKPTELYKVFKSFVESYSVKLQNPPIITWPSTPPKTPQDLVSFMSQNPTFFPEQTPETLTFPKEERCCVVS